MQLAAPLALAALALAPLPASAQHPDHGGGTGGGVGNVTSFPSQGVHLLAWKRLEDFGPQHASGNDCWGHVSASGREYGIIGLSNGIAFLEVTDPGDVTILATIPAPSSLWHDVKTYQDHAYAVSEGGSGIQVFDLSAIDSGVVTQVGTVQTPGPTATHNVAIDEESGFLYRTGGGATAANLGLRAYDLTNPAAPAFVGEWHDHYVHDAQVVTYTSGPFAGMQIAFACTDGNAPSGLDVIDVTDKSSMQSIARIAYAHGGSSSFSHQGWLSPDRSLFYLGDELDEDGVFPSTTYVFDVSDVFDPAQIGSYTNGNTAITHNLYTRGSRIYQANYTSGLRIFDATNPQAPVETAWFDTWPASDGVSFDGLWSCYPYLPGGKILGSDLNSGFFVWHEGAPLLDFDFHDGVPTLLDPAGTSVEVHLHELNPGDLAPGTARLHLDDGTGSTSVPLVSLGGEDFEAAFPPLACGAHVEWYVSARTTDGVTWTSPAGGGAIPYESLVGVAELEVLHDDLETDLGWTVGAPGDTATAGIWTRVDPVGTSSQPADDHTPAPGTMCWVTGQHFGGGSSASDVDGGATTLFTPVLDLGDAAEAVVSYWRWYRNDENSFVDDRFLVDVTSNGVDWVNVETLGPSDANTVGGWIRHEFLVGDLVPLTDQIQLRFVASDLGFGSIVEAAIDDLDVREVRCEVSASYCTGKTSSLACVPFLSSTGFPSAADPGAFRLQGDDFLPGESGLLIYGTQGRSNLSFHGGKLCVKTPFVRWLPSKAANGAGAPPCSGQLIRDFNNRIQGGADPSLTAGQRVNAQYLQRDVADPTGFGDALSDGLEFTIFP